MQARKNLFRDFRGRRLLQVVLRSLHLVGVVGLGAAFVAGLPLVQVESFIFLLVASGATMLALDVYVAPHSLRETSGLAVLCKLALLLVFLLLPETRLPLFWFVLVFSSLISHAPAWLRHRRLFGAKAP